MFLGPLVPTAVTRAKQGRAEIDDTGLIPSFIRDVIFQGLGFVLDVLPPFISNGISALSWFPASCPLVIYTHHVPASKG